MAPLIPLGIGLVGGLLGKKNNSKDKKNDDGRLQRLERRYQQELNAVKADSKERKREHEENKRRYEQMLKQAEERSHQQERQHRESIQAIQEGNKRDNARYEKLAQKLEQSRRAGEAEAARQREAAQQAREADAREWRKRDEKMAIESRKREREFEEYKQRQENEIRQAKQIAAETRRQASQLQDQNNRLQSQIVKNEREQKKLEDSLAREVAARAKQDAQHKQELANMRAESARVRKEHKQEMKKFRREAKLSEKSLLVTRLEDLKRERKSLSKKFNIKFGEMKRAADQVENENRKLQRFSSELNDPSMKRIVLLGLTGDGKSTVANRLVGDVSPDGDCGGPNGGFKTSRSWKSETQKVEKVIHEAFGIKISVVDTPGISDSGGRDFDRQHINNVVGYLRGCGGVNQFLLIKNQSNPRLSGTYQSMLSELEHALGAGFWRFTTVLLTHVENERAFRNFPTHRDELVREISGKFNCGQLKGIGIGIDDYEEVVRDIVTSVVPNEKFICDSLVSPLEELEGELVNLKEEAVKAQQAVEVVEEKIRQVKASLRDVDQILGVSASYDEDGDVHMSEVNKKRRVPDSGFGVGSAKKKRRIG